MHRYLANVVTLQLDEGRCTGCELCVTVCPHGVFAMQSRTARITDRDRCIECGACAVNCAAGAIRVRAGVGCATGLLNASLGIEGDCCCTGPCDASD
jgi:Fe-S-cluster-containing hydrogenase component 2